VMRQPTAIPRSDDLYQALVQTMTDGVFVSQGKRIRIVNQAGLNLLGATSLEQLTEHDPLELLHPSQREIVIQRMRLILEQAMAMPLSVQTWRRLDGSWIEVEVAASATTFEDQPAILLVARAMTDVREAELRLHESEHRYRSLVETAGCVILCLTPEHIITEWNHEAERLSGWSRSEVLGKNYFELMLPREFWDDVATDIRKVLAGEPTRNFEDDMVSRDGKRYTLLWNVTRLLDAHDQPMGIIAIGQDITERKAAEKAHRTQEERLLAIVQNTPNVAMQIFDRHGRVLFWNCASETVFGIKSNDAIGKTLLDLIHTPEEFAQFIVTLGQIEKDRKPVGPLPWTCHRRDGQDVTVLSTLFGIPTEGNGLSFVCMDVDITEHLRTEQALSESQQKLQRQAQLLEESQSAANVGGWELDLLTNQLHWTAETFRIHELSSSSYEPSVDTAIDFYTPECRPVIRAAVARTIETGEPFDLELELITSRGRRIWVRSMGKAQRQDGKVVRVYGAFQNITARKLNEQAIQHFGETQRLMLNELDHRVRNNLASLAALIDISARSAHNVPDLATAIRGRVEAMTAVHVLLSRGHWFSVDLTGLIELMIPGDLRHAVVLEGPTFAVGPRQATALGMVVQELVANSLKHGALRMPEGRVNLKWNTSELSADTVEVRMHWHESGGPSVTGVAQPGVGTELIHGFSRTELGGEATLAYPSEGADHRFVFKLDLMPEADPAQEMVASW